MLLRTAASRGSGRAAAAAAAAAAARGPPPQRRTVVAASSTTSEGYALNLSLAVDKEHEAKSFAQIAKLPPGSLQGLKSEKADPLLKRLGVKTVADLGGWKPFRTARALLTLSKREADGGRPAGSLANVNLAVDKAWERKSLREIVAAPPSALQGVTTADDEALAKLGVKTVEALGKWKYCLWAEAIAACAKLESADFESR
jgi:uncharacterized membrane protein (DUF2068 family)